MTVVSTTKDTDALTLTLVAEFAAPVERLWQLWADPRQLERWWGPPTWPATFVEHDLRTGGRSHYFMTGPEGERMHGAWEFLSVEEPRSLEFEDAFADETGAPNGTMPSTRARVELTEAPGGSRMTITSVFPDVDQMQQLVEMGMEEGITGAVGQIEAILAEG